MKKIILILMVFSSLLSFSQEPQVLNNKLILKNTPNLSFTDSLVTKDANQMLRSTSVKDFKTQLGISNFLSNIVEDLTPQLGGNLDLNGRDITGAGNINTSGNLEILNSVKFTGYPSTRTDIDPVNILHTDISGNLLSSSANYFATKTYVESNYYLQTEIDTLVSNSGGALEFITEAGNTGIAIKGRNPANYGDIGEGAVDLSFSSSASTTRGATGDYSISKGFNTTASGDYSISFGINNTASGNGGSFAVGQSTTSSGNASHSQGNNTLASGVASHAEGVSTIASGANGSHAEGSNTIASGAVSHVGGFRNEAFSFAETVTGHYATNYTPNGVSFIDENDRLFNLGNGTDVNNRSDALTVYKSGNATLNGDLTADKFIGDGSSLTNVDAGALESITEGGNTGIAIKGRNPDNYGDIGLGAVDLSFSTLPSVKGATGDYSLVSGFDNKGDNYSLVSGQYSTGGIFSLVSGRDNSGDAFSLVSGQSNTGGLYSLVSGLDNSGDNYSLVSGLDNSGGLYSLVSGLDNTGDNYSLVSGNNNTGGDYSLVSGNNNTGGDYSLVSGNNNTAPSYAESTLGMFGTTYLPNSTMSYNANDRLFSLGNGTSTSNRSDALIVYKSGNATLNGELTADKFIGDGSQLTNVIRTINTSTLQTSATLNSAFPFADNPDGTIVVNRDAVQSFMYIRVSSQQWKAVSLGSTI